MKSYYAEVLSRLGLQSGSLLEIGAGEGDILVYASRNSELKVRGFDVHEHAGRDRERSARVKTKLQEAGMDEDAYVWISNRDTLPFEDQSIDVMVSLQTLEHVEDIDQLFSEVYRLLAPGGLALHYFPSAETIVDPHSGVPFAHKFPRMRRKLLSLFSCLGIGKYRKYAREHGYSRNEFVDEFDAYLSSMCHYRKLSDYLDLSKKKGLKAWLTPPRPLPDFPLVTKVAARFTSIYLYQRKPEE
jgi:ubiquinone/menaquinone biosynthesis C-methylase UbiE